MTIVTSGNNATGTLGAIDSITISTRGSAKFECPTGTVIAEFSGSRTFGPYDYQSYKITAVQGDVYFEVSDGARQDPVVADKASGILYANGSPVSGAGNIRLTPERGGVLGDSHGAFQSAGGPNGEFNQEYLVLDAGATGTSSRSQQTNKFWLPHIRPSCLPVLLAGISGETTTQILARDGNVASATRLSIADCISMSLDFLIAEGASVNDLLALNLAGYATDAQLQAIASRYISILKKAASAVPLVIAVGIPGFDANGGVVPGNQLFIRDAVSRYNSLLRNYFAGNPDSSIYWLDPVGLSCDATGAFLPGMTTPGDGLHRSFRGGWVRDQAVAKVLEAKFGESAKKAFKGANLLDSLAYWQVGGAIPTGFAWSVASGTATMGTPVIELDEDGEISYRCSFTAVGAGAICQIVLPMNIYSGAPAPAISIASGDKLSLEHDFVVETIDGSPIEPTITFADRIDLRNAGGGRIVFDAGGASNVAVVGVGQFERRLKWHSAHRLKINDVSANITSASVWRMQAALPASATGYHLRLKNPSIVRIA